MNYNELRSSNPNNMDNFLATINMALNAAHQNGSMLEYLEDEYGASELENLLDDLSAGTFTTEWINEINQLFGVQNN